MKTKRVLAMAAVAIVISSLVASCGGGGGSADNGGGGPDNGGVSGVKSVGLTPGSASAHWGKTVQVSAQPTDPPASQ